MTVKEQLTRARQSFNSGITKDVSFRRKQLAQLEKGLREMKQEILHALKEDLNKSHYEGFLTEIGIVLSEVEYARKHIKGWSRVKPVLPTLSQLPSLGTIYPEPYGVVLVLSPWNYPFQLCMTPVIGAIAAGNTVVIKPSKQARETGKVVEKLVKNYLDSFAYQVVLDENANDMLLEEEFDYIFFTGSSEVGKTVLEKASKHLTPVSLELGGKSPCVVDKGINTDQVARRILFGKLLNAGQTCVAPDYLLVQADVKERLVESLINEYVSMMKDSSYIKENFPRIINEKHYKRLESILEGEDILFQDTRLQGDQFPFTIVNYAGHETPLMRDEIFGPILPVVSYKSLDEAIGFIRNKEKPLALYFFSKNPKAIKKILREVSFGGGCINDTVLHLSSPRMPFGGVGHSGMGSYHGKKSFETFSHYKSVLKKGFLGDIPLRYHPYKDPKGTVPSFLLTK